MFSTHRTARRIRISFVIFVGYAMLTAVLALGSPRGDASFWSSYGRWIIGIPVCSAAYVALELLGTCALRLQFWQRLPSWARIPLLVSLIGLGILGLSYFGDAHFTLEVR
jgi:hypothetical protein